MRNAEKDAAEMNAKRELMLDTGFRIFSENVIEAVSMNVIARACNLGIATLYRYFSTKLELVIAIGVRQWENYYREIEELYTKSDGENMTASEEFEFYLDCYISLYRNHKDILRFNRNFAIFVRHEGASPEQLKSYRDAVNVFAQKFHNLYLKAEHDGTLRTDIPEEKLFISSMYIMLPAAAKCAEGFVYLGEEQRDMTEELIMLKNMILNAYITVKGRTVNAKSSAKNNCGRSGSIINDDERRLRRE